MANSYGQKSVENSWISLMKFSWDISVRVAPCLAFSVLCMRIGLDEMSKVLPPHLRY